MASVTDPDGNVVSYIYDATDQRATMTVNVDNTDVQTLTYTHTDGRLTDIDALDNGISTSYRYNYLQNSSLIESTVYANSTSDVMTLDRTYDAADRLLSITSTAGMNDIAAFAYELDARGRRVKRTDLDGTWIDYAYNNRNELIAAERSNYPADNPYGSYPYDYGYEFDAIGNHLKQTKNGTQINGRYNNLNQLLEREIAGEVTVQGTADGEVPVGVKVDGRAADTANIDTDTDAYKGASIIRDRETGEKTISVVATDSHDPPRRTSSTLTAKLPDTNPVEYTYDANGNMLSDGVWLYQWNNENRLTTIETPPGTPASSRARITCTYDHQGRRQTKKTYSWDEQTEEWVLDSELLFLYDQWNLAAEISVDAGQLTVEKTYTWGTDLSGTLQGAGGVGGLLSCSTSSWASFYSYDGNGNVVALVDSSDGTATAEYDYSPFGKTISMSGSAASDNTFRFSTKYHDSETGLVYYGYRYYEPNLGRWMSRDPIGERGGVNLCLSCSNNHISGVDAYGLRVVLPPWWVPIPTNPVDLFLWVLDRIREYLDDADREYQDHGPTKQQCKNRGRSMGVVGFRRSIKLVQRKEYYRLLNLRYSFFRVRPSYKSYLSLYLPFFGLGPRELIKVKKDEYFDCVLCPCGSVPYQVKATSTSNTEVLETGTRRDTNMFTTSDGSEFWEVAKYDWNREKETTVNESEYLCRPDAYSRQPQPQFPR